MFERFGTLFTLLLLLVAGWAVISAVPWRHEVSMFPLFAGIVALVLTAMELGRQMWAAAKGKQGAPAPGDFGFRGWAAPFWFFGCVVGVLFFGIPSGLPLLLVLLLRYGFGESWAISATTGAVMGAVILILFGVVFGVIWPRPLLLDMFD